MRRYSPAWFLFTGGRLVLGAVFVYAAYTKLRESFLLFAMAIDAYQLLPQQAVLFIAHVLPWFELALGIALIAGLWPRITGSSATLLLGVFFTAMVHAYQPDAKEGQISCGCFGLGEPISARTLARDGALLALSISLTAVSFWLARKRVAAAPVSAQPALAEKP